MKSLVVSYIPSNDLHNTEMINRVASFPVSIKLADTTYLIATELTPQQVYDRMHIDPNQDQLYIFTATHPCSGQGSRKVDAWVNSHLSLPERIPAAPPDLIR